MKFYKSKIFWIILLVVVAVSAYFVFGRKKQAPVYTTATAEKGTLKQTVSSTGDVTDSREIILNFEIGGRIGGIFAKEGQSVAAGDKIATIENPVLSSQVAQAKANLDAAIANAGGNDDAIREAEVSVDNAEDALDDTEDLNDRNISAAEQAESDAESYLADAQVYYDAIVADSGADSTEAKTAKLTLSTAQKSYNAAVEAVDIAKRQADLAETNAENTLNLSKSRLKTLKSEFTEDSKDASVLAAKANYDIAVENMSKATLVSPVNGTITRINNKVGEILGTGVIKESFTKVLANDLIIESNIPESDIVKVAVGKKAKVTFDAFDAEEEFDAEVVQIDTDATIIQDVVYYRVKLRLAEVDKRLKPGMSSNIEIATAQRDKVIMVPSRSIKTEGNKKYVEVLKAENVTEKIFVQTGLEGDEGMVEITSGLSGGENVITFVQTK